MSSVLETKIKRIQSDISQNERQHSKAIKDESDSLKKINRANTAINKTKNSTTIRSKTRELERENTRIQKAKKEQSKLSLRISQKTTELNKATNELNKERQKEQMKILKKQEENIDNYKSNQHLMANELHENMENETLKKYDVFISHSADDKEDIVDELATALKQAGINIWYDSDNIGWGKSIRQEVDKGLSYSTYGIVIISSSFIKKYWTNYELDAILNKESSTGKQVILPIWHNIKADEINKYSYSLSNKLALNTAINTIDEIVDNVKKILK